MEPSVPSGRKILIIGGILLVILLAVVSAYLSGKRQGVQTPPVTSENAVTPATGDSLQYRPPQGAKYNALGDLNFLPERIDNITLDKKTLFDEAKQLNPQLSEQDLIGVMNQTIFSWLALNNYYDANMKGQVSPLYKSTGNLGNYADIDKEYHRQLGDFTKGDIRINGFYLLVRFAGVRSENLSQLGKSENQLQPMALNIIRQYINAAGSYDQKAAILEHINGDNQVQLMNNGEKSQSFTDRELFPPLVSDPGYYEWMQNLPVNKFSDVITLKKYNIDTNSEQPYAYAAFYLTNKTGSHLPINILANQLVSSATIQ